VRSSPRIDRRLVQALAALDDPADPIAETHRRLGVVADSLELPRPNYESVRLLLHGRRRSPGRSKQDALLDLAFYTRSPTTAMQDLLSGSDR
jgi:hypothetical protein